MNQRKAFCLSIMMTLGTVTTGSALAQDGSEWTYGIGSGVQFLHAEGDVGLTVQATGEPRTGDLDLSPSDFADMMESMFGFQAFAARDKWKISVAYGTLKLQDDARLNLRDPIRNPLLADFEQDITFAEALVEYKLTGNSKHAWGLIGGVRNTEHEYDVKINLGPVGVRRKLKDDWTDVLVGLTYSYPLSDKVTWNNSAIAGFGGSESYYSFHTAINWQFARNWVAGAYMDYRMIDFENDNPGDPDWYLYDVDEFGPGLTIAYIF